MLKAALEALKKNEKTTQAIQTQKAPQPVVEVGPKLDSDEDELMNLLDEIGHIQAPSIMPTQRQPLRKDVAEAPSSDLFDGIDEDDMMMPALQTTIPVRPTLVSLDQTLLTRARPALGESPTFAVPVVPQVAPSIDRLTFPINPDGFTPELFTRNLTALETHMRDVSTAQRVQLSSISTIDRLSKVPLAIGMITSIDQPTGRDYLVTISDESGSIAVTVHEQVQRESRKKLHYGMMLVLTDCSIFRPSLKSQCLIAVQRNVRYLIRLGTLAWLGQSEEDYNHGININCSTDTDSTSGLLEKQSTATWENDGGIITPQDRGISYPKDGWKFGQTAKEFDQRSVFVDYHEDFEALDTFLVKLGPTQTQVEGSCFDEIFPPILQDISWVRESDLEESVLSCFRKDKALLSRNYYIQSQRINEDSTRCDLIVSYQMSPDGAPDPVIHEHDNLQKLRGRVVSVLELKFGKLGATAVAKAVDQILHYVRELLGNHCGTQKLPFVVMNESQFIVGLAVWNSYADLKIYKSLRVYDIYNRDGTRKSELLKKLYRFVFWKSTPRPRILSETNGNQYKLVRIVGMGASCTAYIAQISAAKKLRNTHKSPLSKSVKASTGPDVWKYDHDIESEDENGEDSEDDDGPSVKVDVVNPVEIRNLEESPVENLYPSGKIAVLKFSSDSAALGKDLEIDRLLDTQFRVGWNRMCMVRRDLYFIVGPFLKPIRRSLFWDPKNCATLRHEDMKYLLQNLLHIHSKGYAHRDIRLQNILQNSSGKFIISDFGAAEPFDISVHYAGTIETASQRILHLLITYSNAQEIGAKAEDDLESLLKCYLIAFKGFVPPDAKKSEDMKNLFMAWMEAPLIRDFLRLRGIDAKVEFLSNLFSKKPCYEDAVQIYKTFTTDPVEAGAPM